MELGIYQVDAFSEKPLHGNPAAIIPLEHWLPDSIMQAIAAENNLSETAFFVKDNHDYHIRWFTPTQEVRLCGHATLASAHIIFNHLDHISSTVSFNSLSGRLTVAKDGEWLKMDFPAQPPAPCIAPDGLLDSFSCTDQDCFKSEDYLLIFENEQQVFDATPDLSLLAKLDLRGVIITAPSHHYDFVCRFFAPNAGINEDPVTGSAFTQLTPYWTTILNKTRFNARQVSTRGGNVRAELARDRVLISGRATTFMRGTIYLPN